MAKKKKEIITFEIPKELVLAKEKPRYNAHQGGTGGHKSVKDYSRKEKYKKDWRRDYD